MLAVLILATLGGWKLDQYLELKFPVFTIVLVLAAIVGLIYKLIQALNDGES